MSAVLGPLSLTPIIERLEAELPKEWREISGAADLEAAEKAKAPTTPAGYVLLAKDSARQPTSATGRFIQPVSGGWGIVIAVRDYRAAQRGAARADELTQRIREVRTAVLGWAHPDGNGTTTRLTGGQLLKFKDGVLWWQDAYAAEYHIRT
jgi:hypothetical protein